MGNRGKHCRHWQKVQRAKRKSKEKDSRLALRKAEKMRGRRRAMEEIPLWLDGDGGRKSLVPDWVSLEPILRLKAHSVVQRS